MKLRHIKALVYIRYAIRRLNPRPLFLVAKRAPPPIRKITSAAEFVAEFGAPNRQPVNFEHTLATLSETSTAVRTLDDYEVVCDETHTVYEPSEVKVTEIDKSHSVGMNPVLAAPYGRRPSMQDMQDGEAEDRYIAMLGFTPADLERAVKSARSRR